MARYVSQDLDKTQEADNCTKSITSSYFYYHVVCYTVNS